MIQMLCVVTLHIPCENHQAVFLKTVLGFFLMISNFIVYENAKTDVKNFSCDLLCKKQVTFPRK